MSSNIIGGPSFFGAPLPEERREILFQARLDQCVEGVMYHLKYVWNQPIPDGHVSDEGVVLPSEAPIQRTTKKLYFLILQLPERGTSLIINIKSDHHDRDCPACTIKLPDGIETFDEDRIEALRPEIERKLTTLLREAFP